MNHRNALIAVALVFIIGRIWIGVTVPPEPMAFVDVYKDLAHVLVGGIGGAWICQRKKWQWRTFWALNVVEVVVAVLSRAL